MSFIDTGRTALRSLKARLRRILADDAQPLGVRAEAQAVMADITPGLRPTPADHVNRKARRAADHKLRQRTRRTGISNREPARYGWAIHNDANNKALQFINHGLLHSLFGRANVWSKSE